MRRKLSDVLATTAHDEHAVKAFEVDALDYLLKPIDPARLAEALTRANSAHAERRRRPEDALEQIFVRDGAMLVRAAPGSAPTEL